MGRLEDTLNRTSDLDWGWWPLLRLRPPRDHDIDRAVLWRLTLLFGPLAGFTALLLVGALHRWPGPGRSLLIVAAATLGYYLVFRCTCAAAWNRRASRLRKEPPYCGRA